MSEQKGLEGAVGLITAAVNHRDDQAYHYYLDGDLCQMSAQREFLVRRGMDVGQRDVYPVLRSEEDFKKALELLWRNRIAGWWHYHDKLIKYGICTEDEFKRALGIAVKKGK